MKKILIVLALATVATVGYSQVTNTVAQTPQLSSDIAKVVQDVFPNVSKQEALNTAVLIILGAKFARKYVGAARTGKVGALLSHVALVEPQTQNKTPA